MSGHTLSGKVRVLVVKVPSRTLGAFPPQAACIALSPAGRIFSAQFQLSFSVSYSQGMGFLQQCGLVVSQVEWQKPVLFGEGVTGSSLTNK